MALPEFFVAGAPKAGTTALHAALAKHPSLYMSAVKEPKFSLTDGPPPAKGGPGDALRSSWTRSDSRNGRGTCPPPCRAGSASAWRSPARCSPTPAC